VDQADLIQLHNLVEENDWRTTFSPGGVVEALFRKYTDDSRRPKTVCHEDGVALPTNRS